MNRRSIRIILLLGLIGIGGGIAGYVQQTVAFGPLPTYATTIIADRPATGSCINKGGKTALAIELIDLGKDLVYLSGGDNPITEPHGMRRRCVSAHEKLETVSLLRR